MGAVTEEQAVPAAPRGSRHPTLGAGRRSCDPWLGLGSAVMEVTVKVWLCGCVHFSLRRFGSSWLPEALGNGMKIAQRQGWGVGVEVTMARLAEIAKGRVQWRPADSAVTHEPDVGRRSLQCLLASREGWTFWPVLSHVIHPDFLTLRGLPSLFWPTLARNPFMQCP